MGTDGKDIFINMKFYSLSVLCVFIKAIMAFNGKIGSGTVGLSRVININRLGAKVPVLKNKINHV
jgi:hypothetical protein